MLAERKQDKRSREKNSRSEDKAMDAALTQTVIEWDFETGLDEV